jgi:hypothetical protein
MKKISFLILLAGCANKVNVPQDVYVHPDPVKVEVTINGDITIKLLQILAADPVLAKTIETACSASKDCIDGSTQDIMNSIISQLSSVTK